MKKIIVGIVLIIVIATIGGFYYVLTNLDSLVKAAIETHGSEATQTAVRVSQVKIDLSKGGATINGLTVANTSGFSMPLAFSLGEITAAIDLQSLQKEPYIINEITVLSPQVFVEINKDNETNLNQLKNNLLGNAKPATKPQVVDDNAGMSEPRIIIRKLVFADGDINAKVVALKNKEYKLKLPSIHLSNMGGSKGATPSELSMEIINHLTDQASAVVKEKVIDAELDKLKAKANAKIDEEKVKLKEKTDAYSREQKQKASDKLKGLFNK